MHINAGLTPNAAEQRYWSAYKPVAKMTRPLHTRDNGAVLQRHMHGAVVQLSYVAPQSRVLLGESGLTRKYQITTTVGVARAQRCLIGADVHRVQARARVLYLA